MLHAQETFVERAAFAVVDVHTHITVSAKSQNGVALAAERSYLGKPDELLSVMDRKNIRAIQADAIERAQRAGAKGLKILKTLGLYLRENITSGKLVKIDDPRFDPMW